MDYEKMWRTLKAVISDDWDTTIDRLADSYKCKAYSDCIRYDVKADTLQYVISTMRTIEKTSEKYDKD